MLKNHLQQSGEKYLTDESYREEVSKEVKKGLSDFTLLMHMVNDYIAGKYTEVPRTAIAVITGAVIIMVAPDFFGPFDEMLVLGVLMAEFKVDIERYREWRLNQEFNVQSLKVVVEGLTYTIDPKTLNEYTTDKLKEAAYSGLATEPERHSKE